MKKTLKSKDFIKTAVCGAVITAAVIWLGISRERGVLTSVCDGFFASGILLLCYAGLIFSRNQGTFDIFSYGVTHLFSTRWPGLSTMPDEHRREKYSEYKERVQKKRKFPMGVLFAAVIYMAVAIILFVIYLLV